MMIMREDHRRNVGRGIKTHPAQPRADFLMRGDSDTHFFREKGIPRRQVAGRGVFRGVPGIHNELALRVLDEPREDFQRSDPVLVAKNIELSLEGIASFTAAFLRGFHPCLARWNGGDLDHWMARCNSPNENKLSDR